MAAGRNPGETRAFLVCFVFNKNSQESGLIRTRLACGGPHVSTCAHRAPGPDPRRARASERGEGAGGGPSLQGPGRGFASGRPLRPGALGGAGPGVQQGRTVPRAFNTRARWPLQAFRSFCPTKHPGMLCQLGAEHWAPGVRPALHAASCACPMLPVSQRHSQAVSLGPRACVCSYTGRNTCRMGLGAEP